MKTVVGVVFSNLHYLGIQKRYSVHFDFDFSNEYKFKLKLLSFIFLVIFLFCKLNEVLLD